MPVVKINGEDKKVAWSVTPSARPIVTDPIQRPMHTGTPIIEMFAQGSGTDRGAEAGEAVGLVPPWPQHVRV
jgi:hypothetical protein